MANICDNTFHFQSEDEGNIKAVTEFFEKWSEANIEWCDYGECDVYFDSRWTFPEEQMEELYESMPNKDDLYMRCLSVEYGCMYHALWECDKDGWQEV